MATIAHANRLHGYGLMVGERLSMGIVRMTSSSRCKKPVLGSVLVFASNQYNSVNATGAHGPLTCQVLMIYGLNVSELF